METIITNKSNWTGEECEIVIQNDGSFSIGMFVGDEPYVFQMTEKVTHFDDGGEVTDYFVNCPMELGWTWVGILFDGQVIFSDMGIEREDENPYVAFAKLAWNII